MKTFSPKQPEIKREWHLIDVKGKTLGKAATRIANILRGKDKPVFAPHVDCGDYVVIINAAHIKLTGNKYLKKEYNWHSRYPGGLKTARVEEVLEKNPTNVLERAVIGMIPRNKIRNDVIKKMKIYPEAEHKNQAQNPQPLEI